jgi:hypothetical protein
MENEHRTGATNIGVGEQVVSGVECRRDDAVGDQDTYRAVHTPIILVSEVAQAVCTTQFLRPT